MGLDGFSACAIGVINRSLDGGTPRDVRDCRLFELQPRRLEIVERPAVSTALLRIRGINLGVHAAL